MKKIIFITAGLLIGIWIYAYTQKKEANQPAAEKPNTQTISIKSISNQQDTVNIDNQRPVALNILPDTHSDLTNYEKSLVSRINASSVLVNSYLKGVTSKLKFYDGKTVVFSLPTKKDVSTLFIYDINTLTNINSNDLEINLIDKFNNYIATNNYIIAIGSINYGPYDTNNDREVFLFYKKGDTNFRVVTNSQILKTETYFENCLSADSCTTDFTFDEKTKTLSASMFKIIENLPNTKIRTMKFVLD